MKFGIFGGSFNPVHLGHLLVSEDIREKLKLDKIIFIPSFDPPHKKNLLPFHQRYKMLKMAIENNRHLAISDIEKRRCGKSFTVDTLRELKKSYPRVQLYFVMGIDQYIELATWKEPEKLFRYARIVVISRPGFRAQKFKDQRPIFLDVIKIDIASAQIRKRIRQNLSVRYMLPESVWHYIIKNKLYQP